MRSLAALARNRRYSSLFSTVKRHGDIGVVGPSHYNELSSLLFFSAALQREERCFSSSALTLAAAPGKTRSPRGRKKTKAAVAPKTQSLSRAPAAEAEAEEDAAEMPPPAKPSPAGTPSVDRQRVGAAASAAESAAALSADEVVIDMGALVAEWRALVCDVQLHAADSPLLAAQGTTAATSPSPKRMIRQELNLAERAILLTNIQERGESYPYLFALFNVFTDGDSSSEVKTPVQLHNFEDVFKEESVTSWYLFLLKIYGQLARQRPVLIPTFVQLSASTTAHFAAQKGPQRSRITYMKVMFLNELFRSLSAVDTIKKVAARPGKGAAAEGDADEEEDDDGELEFGEESKPKRKKKKKRARKIRQADLEQLHFQKICQNLSVQFLESCVDSLPRRPVGNSNADTTSSVAECILEEAFWSLAADVGDSVLSSLEEGEQDKIHCAQWRQYSQAAAARVRLLFKAPPPSVAKDTVLTELLCDVIDGLRYMQELELVLPHAQRQLIEAEATDTVQRVCVLAAKQEHLLLALSSAELARRVESIRRQQAGEQVPTRAYTQVCTCIFAAIAHLLASPARVHALCEAAETTCHAALEARGATVPVRPPLHSPRAELCYALLCAGYAPDAILKSALCTALPVVDLVDVVRAAALFSDHFSYEALPARVRTSLQQSAHALVDQALRDTRRMVSQPQQTTAADDAAADSTLAARLAHFKPKNEQGRFLSLETASFFPDADAKKRQVHKKRRLRGSKKQRKEEEEESLQVTSAADVRVAADEAFYVSLSYIVEALVRGEAQEAQRLLIALLPLLESEGGVLMVANALEHVVQQVGERLRQCGRLRREALQLAHAVCEPPAALEEGLELISSIVLPRVSQSVQRLIARSSGGGGGNAGAADGTRQKHVITSAKEEEEELQFGLSTQTVAQLVEPLTVGYTAAAITCGTPPSAMAQLVSLHQVLLRAADMKKPSELLEQTLRRVSAFLTQVGKLQFASPRPQRSAAGRYTNTAINEIVATQIQHGTEALRGKATTEADHVANGKAAVALVRLLYKVNTVYPVATEPAVIHDLRVELLDPLLTQTVLADPKQPASLLLLSEMAHIMCRRESVHHISVPFYTALAQSVKARVELRTAAGSGSASQQQEGSSGTLAPHATRLLLASVLVCLRGELFLDSFLTILDATGDLVALSQARSVLHELLQVGGPVGCAAARRMRERLLQTLQSPKTSMLLTDRVEALQTIVQCERADPTRSLEGGTPYLREMVLRLTQPSILPRLRLSSCGVLVAIVADLKEMSKEATSMPSSTAREEEEEEATSMAAINALPARLAALILPRLQSCDARDVPVLVHGYAQLPVADATFCGQMLRAFISRTIRAVPQLTPADVVCCVQAYCRAAVYHQYLFGILLSRMSDSPQSVSLELSVQLLQCGMASTLPEVRRACLTAGKPIFLAHVRHVLQHDQHMLAAVASVSVVVLQCLREGFAKDAICGLVLEAIARHHHAAGLAVMKAALRLIAARGSSDFDALRVLSDSCIHQQLPTCEMNAFAGLTYWLVQCGVHSVVLLQCVKTRLVAFQEEQESGGRGGAAPSATKKAAGFKKLEKEKAMAEAPLKGESLALLAQAFERAFVESDTTILNVMATETIRMVDSYKEHTATATATTTKTVPVFSLPQVAALLNYYYAAGPGQIAPLRPAVDALLSYTRLVSTTVPSWSPVEAAAAAATNGPTVSPLHLIAILRACGTQSSGAKTHEKVSLYCADVAAACLGGHEATAAGAAPADDTWRGTELLQLVQLADFLTGHSGAVRDHAAVKLLLDVLYERRATLLQRQLLRTTAQSAVRRVPTLHPDLSRLLEIEPVAL